MEKDENVISYQVLVFTSQSFTYHLSASPLLKVNATDRSKVEWEMLYPSKPPGDTFSLSPGLGQGVGIGAPHAGYESRRGRLWMGY